MEGRESIAYALIAVTACVFLVTCFVRYRRSRRLALRRRGIKTYGH